MKLGNSIFRKMLLSEFLVIVVSLLIMDFYLTRYMADQQTERRGTATGSAGTHPGRRTGRT